MVACGERYREGEKGGITKGHRKLLSDEYIHYLDCGDGFTNIYVKTY